MPLHPGQQLVEAEASLSASLIAEHAAVAARTDDTNRPLKRATIFRLSAAERTEIEGDDLKLSIRLRSNQVEESKIYLAQGVSCSICLKRSQSAPNNLISFTRLWCRSMTIIPINCEP